MKTYRDIVLIEVDKPKKKTASGIFIVEDWKTLPPMGIVKSIGPDVKDRELVGKHVIFERYTSVTVGFDNTKSPEEQPELRFCREVNLLAELEDGEGA